MRNLLLSSMCVMLRRILLTSPSGYPDLGKSTQVLWVQCVRYPGLGALGTRQRLNINTKIRVYAGRLPILGFCTLPVQKARLNKSSRNYLRLYL